MPQKFSNKARSQLLAAITTTDTSFSVVAAEADLFPTADVGTGTLPSAPGDWFKAVIEDSNGYEIVYVRTRSAGSNVFSNVLRGQEGTTARSFPAGAVVGLRVTAQDAETAAKVPDLQAQITGLASSKLDVAAPSFGGNAATATRLQTARTLTIGSTSKTFNGSANVSWSLAEIGATNANGDYIVRDTRNVDTPTNLGTTGVRYEFKLNTTDGLNDGGTHHAVMTFQPWIDSSGDNTHQLGFTTNGNLWLRTAPIGGTWGPWRRFWHDGNFVVTTEQVLNATAWAPVGAVGTYAFLWHARQFQSTYAPGQTLAGSWLAWANGEGPGGPQGIAGTWRCMGRTAETETLEGRLVTLWLRIS